MSSPIVSVVVPCYNHERYLETALRSILDQDASGVELIVVNDGSQDGSLDLMTRMSREYGFIVMDQPNGGLAAAVDAGFRRSTGTFFITCDADDVMLPGRISRQVGFMLEHPDIGCCGANFEYIDTSGQPMEGAPRKEFGIYKFKELFETDGLWLGAGTTIYRRDAMIKAGGYDTSIKIQDLQMELKVAYAGYNVAIIEDMVTLYRRHDSNMSSNYKANFYVCMKAIEPYSAEPGYLKALRSLVNGALKKAVIEDKPFARALFSLLPLNAWDRKTFSRFRRYLFR